MTGEGGRGAFEDGELVAFDIDLDEPYVSQVVVIDPAGLDLDLVGVRDYLRVELVGRIDRRATKLGSAVVAVGQSQLGGPAPIRDCVRLDPAALTLEHGAQDPVEHRDRLEGDHLRRVTPDPIGVHADLGADVDAGAVALAQQIEQLHLALVVVAAQAPDQKDQPRHSAVRERYSRHDTDTTVSIARRRC